MKGFTIDSTGNIRITRPWRSGDIKDMDLWFTDNMVNYERNMAGTLFRVGDTVRITISDPPVQEGDVGTVRQLYAFDNDKITLARVEVWRLATTHLVDIDALEKVNGAEV